jgi:predicted DNA-binding transcriptional regulator YafY
MRTSFRVTRDRPVQEEESGSIILSAGVAGTGGVKHRVMSWGKNAEVLEPDILRRKVVQELSACLQRYGSEGRRADEI